MGDQASRPSRVFPIRLEALGGAGRGPAAASTGTSTGTSAAPGPHAGPAGAAGGEPQAGDSCSSGESFALMVLGDSMLPEFAEGEVIVIEPDGLAADGSFVLAWCGEEWIFRQLVRDAHGWRLRALNPAYPEIALPDLDAVRGVVIQKSRPGRRRANKRYVA